MCSLSEAFQPAFLGWGQSRWDLTDFLAWLPRLPGQIVEHCEELITPEEVIEAMADCKSGKGQGLDGLPYELYMPYLFEQVLAEVFMDWQQNGVISRSMHQGVATLVGKTQIMEIL